MSYRTGPLAIDPVISSQQSQGEFDSKQRQYLSSVVGIRGPSIKKDTPVVMGKYVLARSSPTTGVSLFLVRNIGPMMSMTGMDLTATCQEYSHSPNPNVSGLFGAFQVRRIPNAAGGGTNEVRQTLTRENIIVYNAELFCHNNKKRYLSLETLRELARALPSDYPMPAERRLPETHLPPRNKRQTSNRPSGHDSSDDESEGSCEDSDDSPEESGDDQEAGSEDHGADSSDSSIDADEEYESELNEMELAAIDAENAALCEESPAAGNASATVTAPAPIVPAVSVKGSSLCLLNMQGNHEKEYRGMKIPVALVFVRDVNAASMRVCWYQLAGADFNTKVTSQVWKKFWTDPDWLKKEGLDKRKSSKSKRSTPSTEQIFRYWYGTTEQCATALPIQIPPSLYDVAKLVENDSYRMPTSFIVETLIPYYNSLPSAS
jgi:hypothetical protein